jgi:hypothetical protein
MAVDHTKFSKGGSATDPKADEGSFDKRWWLSNKTDMADNVIRLVNYLIKNDSARLSQYQMNARLYSNMQGLGLAAQRAPNINQQVKTRISYNLIQSGIDTIVAKMAKNKPKPLFLTSGGDWKIQRRAKKLDKFCEGIAYENKGYKLGPSILRDSGVFGDGLVQVFNLHDRVKWERVEASCLFVDPVEGIHGNPRQLHMIKPIDRQVLLEMYPEKSAAIKRAMPMDPKNLGFIQNVSDQLMVVKSWHLPSGPDSNDGIAGVFIEGEYLEIEDYDWNCFPFAKLPWAERMFGYWAQSGAEQVQNTQLEINQILWVIQRSMKLMGSFKIWMSNASKIVKEHFNNDIGSIITGDVPPQYLVPPIVAPELYSHLQTLKNFGFEQLGVSMLSAASQKPEGLDSGKALREFNNIESDRFQVLGQKYEQFFLDLADLSIKVAKKIYEKNGEYKVQVPGKKFIEEIDWKDVDLEEDQFVMKVYPVSSLPNDPAGRLQTVQEYMQAGMLNLRQGRRLLDFPDLEQAEGLANAAEDWIHECLEKIIDDAEYTAPDENDDLQTAMELVMEYIAQAKQTDLDTDRMNMLLTYQAQVKTLLMPPPPPPGMAPGGAPAPGGPPPQGGQPLGVPAPPPVSDMLPNAPGGAA